ncbi:hypothetical protein OSTOST_24164 [Ostertagia ostertagi]
MSLCISIIFSIIVTYQQEEWLRKSRHRESRDETHNATRYNLKLATVTVLNKRDTGVPAGGRNQNANARADCLVDLLIRAVEEMSKSDEIKDNRAGISCIHRHAVMLHGQAANKAAFRITPDQATEEEVGVPGDTAGPRIAPHGRNKRRSGKKRQQRDQLRNSINMQISVLQTNVNALVNTDTGAKRSAFGERRPDR